MRNCVLTHSLKNKCLDFGGHCNYTLLSTDQIKFNFIAATFGRQPTALERTQWVDTNHPDYGTPIFPNLVHCEWSVTAEPSGLYNCIAFTVNVFNESFSPWEIDMNEGNKNGVFETYDMDEFFRKRLGLYPTANGPADAVIMYYEYENDWNYMIDPMPTLGFHAAKKKASICGMGKWDNDMFESKCGSSGETFRIEHRSDQLNNLIKFYGQPTRFYK